MPYPCFLLTPHPSTRIHLRRYVSGEGNPCPLPQGYHDAMTFFGDFDNPIPERYETSEFANSLRPPDDDPRWPTHCECGYKFEDTATRQMFNDRLMSRSDGGLITLREAPPGALWYAFWMKNDDGSYGWNWDNQSTPPLMCKTPGGDWNIDSRCSNCGLPQDRLHRCWIRHGEPPNIHVDKNGNTCQAGAGSIVCGKYHGFLHNGVLTDNL
jgi:hypothetical protein